MNSRKKEASVFTYSYLDLIILLLVGLFLSLGIYVGGEKRRAEESELTYNVLVSVPYRTEIAHAIPKAGDVLFDENGARIGMIQQTEAYESEGEKMYFITFSVKGVMPREGEDFQVETAYSTATAKVLSVEEEGKEESV